jgi:hypothetical protein
MKEKELIALNFNRKYVTAEESGYQDDWHYYDMDFGEGGLTLISPSNDEVENDEWYVDVLHDNTIRFTNISDVKTFIDLIKRNTMDRF